MIHVEWVSMFKLLCYVSLSYVYDVCGYKEMIRGLDNHRIDIWFYDV